MDVRFNAFKGMAKVCRDGELEHEDMPLRARKVIGHIRDQVHEDVEARHALTNKIMWESTDCHRFLVGETEGRGTITFTYVL